MEDETYIKDFFYYSKWLIVGWFLGLIIGKIFDHYFSFGNPIFEGIARYVAGYGDTLGGVVAVMIVRYRYKRVSRAETFAIGTVIGDLSGPLLHFLIIILGFSTAGIAGAIYAIAYSNGDNWGGVIASLIKELKRHRFIIAFKKIYKNKFVVANFFVLIFLALMAISVRIFYGFAPSSYFTSALEGVILNNDSTLAVLIFFIYVKYKKSPAIDS